MTRIRHTMTTLLLTGCALVMTMGIVCLGKVGQAEAGPLTRLSAEYLAWNGSELYAYDPTNIYTKTLFVPQGNNILYITMATTGDSYYGVHAFRATVDGVSAPFAGAYTYATWNDWIILQDQSSANSYYLENGMSYTWCKLINPGTRTVNIDMRDWSEYDGVYIEGLTVYIDASNQSGAAGGACTQGSNWD